MSGNPFPGPYHVRLQRMPRTTVVWAPEAGTRGVVLSADRRRPSRAADIAVRCDTCAGLAATCAATGARSKCVDPVSTDDSLRRIWRPRKGLDGAHAQRPTDP